MGVLRGGSAGRVWGAALVLALVTSGCAAPSRADQDGEEWLAAQAAKPPPPHEPVEVPGASTCEGTQPPVDEPVPGKRLPQLRLACLTPGPDVDLSHLRGRPTLVNVWASWCGPCQREMPVLQQAHERLGDRVRFLGVNTQDSAASAAAFLAETGGTYPNVVDFEAELLARLGIPGMPVTVILDAEGRVVATHVGELKEDSLNALLSDSLGVS